MSNEETRKTEGGSGPSVRVQAVGERVLVAFVKPVKQLVISPENAIALGKAVARAGREARSQRARAAQASAPRRR